jgi:hypothetical protein
LAPPGCDDRLIWSLDGGSGQFPLVCAADELGLFVLLSTEAGETGAGAGALTRVQVAERLALGARAAEVLLGALTAIGLLVQHNGRFVLTEAARTYLLPASPYYIGGWLALARALPPQTPQGLLKALRNDRPVIYGADDMWERHEADPAQARAFAAFHHPISLAVAVSTTQRVDFAGVSRLLDVGGGSGAWCIALAQAFPRLRCTILDLSVVCALAEEYVAQHGLSGRIDTAAADMFVDPWPTGYDAVLLSNVLHDWDRPRCLHLLRRAAEALPQGGRVYINEQLLNDTKDGPVGAALMSVVMLLWTRGKQYTAAELEDLLTEAGFADPVVTPTTGDWSLVRGTKR